MKHGILIILFLIGSRALAQRQYDVWFFGNGITVDFRTKPPTVRNNGPTRGNEGHAMYGDPVTGEPRIIVSGGEDLFIAGVGGERVFDRNYGLMPNGDTLIGEFSAAQAALIVPWPCHENLFFVITNDQQGYHWPSKGSHYSVVDLSLNDGLGAVTTKNISLNPNTDEHLTAVHVLFGEDYWLILHSNQGNTFYAYRVSAHGIDPNPVTSSVGTVHGPGYSLGYLKASPNGRKLAIAGGWIQLAELFDFDPLTGKVSNPLTLFRGEDTSGNDTDGPYGLCFSPDNSKLYYTAAADIYQCDVTGTNEEVLRSREIVDMPSAFPNKHYFAAALSPEGKIYFIGMDRLLSAIEAPNEKGSACRFRDTGLVLMAGAQVGLPNMIEGSAIPMPDVVLTSTASDTITDNGVIVVVRITSDILHEGVTLHGHYDDAKAVLTDVFTNGIPSSDAIKHVSGVFEIPVPVSTSYVDLTFAVKTDIGQGSLAISVDSVAIAGYTISSCDAYTQTIDIASCVAPILSKFLRTGKPKFTIRPNPADNTIAIESSVDADRARIEVSDALGKKYLVESHDLRVADPHTMKISSLPAGLYFLRLYSNGFVSSQSFMVSR